MLYDRPTAGRDTSLSVCRCQGLCDERLEGNELARAGLDTGYLQGALTMPKQLVSLSETRLYGVPRAQACPSTPPRQFVYSGGAMYPLPLPEPPRLTGVPCLTGISCMGYADQTFAARRLPLRSTPTGLMVGRPLHHLNTSKELPGCPTLRGWAGNPHTRTPLM